MKTMNLNKLMENVSTVAIAGHIRPDGDCVGSCMALYNYLKENYQADVDVYLDSFSEMFRFIKDIDKVCVDGEKKQYDLFFALDCGDRERIGGGSIYFENAAKTVCIDHHISNTGYGDEALIVPDASATAEILYGLFEREKMSRAVAECLYMAIAHDTGVFQYSNVTPKTMRIAADLLEFNFDFSTIISKTFFEKTYKQKRVLGYALANSVLFMDGRCVFSVIKQEDMERYEIGPLDLEGIVAELRNTSEVECAVFLYQTNVAEFKVSLRSKRIVDVGKVAVYFKGGGHVRAAGCTMSGSVQDVLNNLSRLIAKQLSETEQ